MYVPKRIVTYHLSVPLIIDNAINRRNPDQHDLGLAQGSKRGFLMRAYIKEENFEVFGGSFNAHFSICN